MAKNKGLWQVKGKGVVPTNKATINQGGVSASGTASSGSASGFPTRDSAEEWAANHLGGNTYWNVDTNSATGESKINWSNNPNDVYPYLRETQEIMEKLVVAQEETNKLGMEQVEIAERMAALAEERYNYWKDNFQPFEKDLIDQANKGIDANVAAGKAGKSMEAGFTAAKGATNRYFERLGIDPADPRAALIDKDMQFARTAALVGAKQKARTTAEDVTREMRMAVAGMGRGVSIGSSSAFGQSASSIGQAATSGLRGAAGVADAGLAQLTAGVGNSMFQNNVNAANNQLRNEIAFGKDINQWNSVGQLFQTIGQVAGTAGTVAMFDAAGGGVKQTTKVPGGTTVGQTLY